MKCTRADFVIAVVEMCSRTVALSQFFRDLPQGSDTSSHGGAALVSPQQWES